MADILEEIVAHKRIEIEQRKRFIQPRQMITLTEQKMQEDGGKVPGGSMKESLMKILWVRKNQYIPMTM